MSVGGPDPGGAPHPGSPSVPAKEAGGSRRSTAHEQQHRHGRPGDEAAYRPVSMSMSPPKPKKQQQQEKPGSSPAPPSLQDQETYAEAVSGLAPDDMPCPSGGGDSHEFVARWTFWDLVAGCFCCPCHTFSACMCTYLYRDPRKDSFDGTGCKGTGKKTCVKCGQTWEEAEGYLVELKRRAAAAGPSSSRKAPPAAERPAVPSKAAAAASSGKGGGNEGGRVRNKDRLKRGPPPPHSAAEY